MSSNKIVIRVHTLKGRSRLELPIHSSIEELYEAVAIEFHADPKSLTIYTDDKFKKILHRTKRHSLSSSKFENGQIIYLKDFECQATTPQQEMNTSSSSSSAPYKEEAAVEDAPKEKVPEGKTEPKFKSFDVFLKEKSFSITDLPLSKKYESVILDHGKIISLPLSVSLKHQPYRHVDHIEFINVAEMKNFVDYWMNDLQMQEQRGGWLIGQYFEDANYVGGIRAVVEAIYEPYQNDQESIEFMSLLDKELENVKEITDALGLCVVGHIFTHYPRDELLTSSEVVHIAKLQLQALQFSPKHYTGYHVSPFVTVTLHYSVESQNVVTNAFMVSDLGMALVRDNILAEIQDNPSKISIRKPLQREILLSILESGENVTSFDPDWMIVRINDSAPIKTTASIFKSWTFPVENRQRLAQLSDVADHFEPYKDLADLTPFADFHFILYLSTLFDVETAKTICKALVSNSFIDLSLMETLRSLSSSSISSQ